MLDMTDCGLIAEMSSLTDNRELAEPIGVELVGAGGPWGLGGLGADTFFFFLTGGGGGGLTVFIVLGRAPVRGAATGVDISQWSCDVLQTMGGIIHSVLITHNS